MSGRALLFIIIIFILFCIFVGAIYDYILRKKLREQIRRNEEAAKNRIPDQVVIVTMAKKKTRKVKK